MSGSRVFLQQRAHWRDKEGQVKAAIDQTKEGVVIIKKSSCTTSVRSFLGMMIVLPLFLLSSCHYREDSSAPVHEETQFFERIAVVPFLQILPDESLGGAAQCPLCGVTVNATPVEGHPEQVLETLFLEHLTGKKPKFSVMGGDRVAAVFRRISANSLKTSHRQVLRDVGNDLGVEAVVAGYLHRFRERKGFDYTVESPASVTFEIHLLRVKDGALIWRGFFDKTQSSLMEDLFQVSSFYRGGGRWVTAAELAEEGVEQVLKSFPGLH